MGASEERNKSEVLVAEGPTVIVKDIELMRQRQRHEEPYHTSTKRLPPVTCSMLQMLSLQLRINYNEPLRPELSNYQQIIQPTMQSLGHISKPVNRKLLQATYSRFLP